MRTESTKFWFLEGTLEKLNDFNSRAGNYQSE
jgi:hypothetical protein